MKFKFKDYKVYITIEDYEFKDINYMDKYDSNWLIVKITYQNRYQKIVKKDAVLLVSELIELREWFNKINNFKIIKTLTFIENSLGFMYVNKSIIVSLCFGLSLYDTKSINDECCILKLNLDKDDLEDILSELDLYIIKYPIR